MYVCEKKREMKEGRVAEEGDLTGKKTLISSKTEKSEGSLKSEFIAPMRE